MFPHFSFSSPSFILKQSFPHTFLVVIVSRTHVVVTSHKGCRRQPLPSLVLQFVDDVIFQIVGAFVLSVVCIAKHHQRGAAAGDVVNDTSSRLLLRSFEIDFEASLLPLFQTPVSNPGPATRDQTLANISL